MIPVQAKRQRSGPVFPAAGFVVGLVVERTITKTSICFWPTGPANELPMRCENTAMRQKSIRTTTADAWQRV
jgi:hypothetical protein